jgi:hypothetical protein
LQSLATGKAKNLPDMFILADNTTNRIYPKIFECLLTCPHLFDKSNVVDVLCRWWPVCEESCLLLFLLVETCCTIEEAYRILQGTQNGNTYLVRILNRDLILPFQKLLQFLPIVEIDLFFNLKWNSMETLMMSKSAHFQELGRTARQIMEEYRMYRQMFIFEHLDGLPSEICFIINEFGKRPIN